MMRKVNTKRTIGFHKAGGDVFDKGSSMQNLCHYLAKQDGEIFLVVSAKKGITRILSLAYDVIIQKRYFKESLENKLSDFFLDYFLKSHEHLMKKMFKGESLSLVSIAFDEIFQRLNREIEQPISEIFFPSVVKYGELATALMTIKCFEDMGVDCELINSQDFLLTTEGKDADILCVEKEINDIFNKRKKIIVAPGYIGRDMKGRDSALGYDGSDMSVAIFANYAFENITENISTTFWKNVFGVMTADPHEVPNAEFLKEVIYPTYMKLSTVPVRKDAIAYLLEHKIPTFIRSFLDLSHPGTRIIY